MMSISDSLITEEILQNLKSQGSVIGKTVMSSLPSILSMGGLISMGASALTNPSLNPFSNNDPTFGPQGIVPASSTVGSALQSAMPIGIGMSVAGMVLRAPQMFSNTANTVKSNYQRSRNEEMMRRYQQQNPQYFQQQQYYPQQNYGAR